MNKISLIAAFFLGILPASALELNVQPGQLASAVGSEAAAVTSLTLSGSVDASDLFYISSSMPELRSLNMGSCAVSAYSGAAINGVNTFAANTIPAGVFAGTVLEEIVLPEEGRLYIGEFAFAGSGIRSLVLPAGTQELGAGAFSSCPQLVKVVFKSNVSSGGYVFKSCPALYEVDLSGVTVLNGAEFADCVSLEVVTNTNALTVIGPEAFEGCENLHNFSFGTSLKSIGDEAFAGSGLQHVDLFDCKSLSSVGAWAFAKNPVLESVRFPVSLQSIGEGVFFDCSALKTLNIPENCTVIPAYAFKSAALPSSLVIPEGVQEIANHSMLKSGVTELTIPASLERIGDNAMEGMSSLQTIQASEVTGVPELGEDVWKDVNAASVTLNVNKDYVEDYKGASQWQDFHIIGVATLVNPIDTPERYLRGHIEGDDLVIVSSEDIEDVKVYTILGVLVAEARPESAECRIDLSRSNAPYLIIYCKTGTGTGTLKLAR